MCSILAHGGMPPAKCISAVCDVVRTCMQVTFVVVSKSHGTRLFPHPQDPHSSDAYVGGRSGNVVPGTVVDTHITAPLKFEFFLNSHAGIQVCLHNTCNQQCC